MEPSDYGPFDYVPITQRPRVTWPNGAQLAVWVIPNLEFFPLTRGLAGHPFEGKGKAPTVRAWGQRDYGNRVGIWRMMDVFQKLDIRATAAINSDVCEQHPQIVRAAVDLKWEFMGHNVTNTVRLSELEPEQERATIKKCTETIAAAAGVRPVGWLGSALAESWNTLEYLADEGYEYVADWVNDDQPFMMRAGNKKLVAIPYSYEVNDSPLIYYRNGTAEEFENVMRRQFDVLYEEGKTSGRVMAICLHPFLMGVPHRIGALESGLKYIRSHDRVWFATGQEIVRHYLAAGATF